MPTRIGISFLKMRTKPDLEAVLGHKEAFENRKVQSPGFQAFLSWIYLCPNVLGSGKDRGTSV
jgi:hypothetical protein